MVNGNDKKSAQGSAVGKPTTGCIPSPAPLSHNLFHPGAVIVTPSPKKQKTKTSNNKRKAAKGSTSSTEQQQDVLEASLEHLLPHYTPSRLSQEAKGKSRLAHPIHESCVKDCDILFGRGTTICSHPGNVTMRQVVALNQPYYKQASRPDKHVAADCLVRYFENRGARFLERKCFTDPTQGYVPVPYDRVLEKIMQSCREKVTYRGVGGAATGWQSAPPPPVTSSTTSSASIMVAPGRAAKRPKTQTKNPSKTRENTAITSTTTDVFHKPREVGRKRKTKDSTVQVGHKPKKVASAKVGKKHKVDPSNKRPHTSTKFSSSSKTGLQPWLSVSVGDRLGIFWELDQRYYPGVVELKEGSKVRFFYDDHEREWVDLAKNEFILWTTRSHDTKNRSAKTNKQPHSLKKASSRENSIQTQDSTDASENVAGRRKAKGHNTKNKQVSICIQGSFSEPVAAPSLSLASFLRRQLDAEGAAMVAPAEAMGLS